MRVSFFFKTVRPKQFNYVPRYWDPQKEEAEDRQRRIEREMGINQDGKSSYRMSIRRGTMSQKLLQRRKSNRATSLRLVLIIAILCLAVWYFLTGDFRISI